MKKQEQVKPVLSPMVPDLGPLGWVIVALLVAMLAVAILGDELGGDEGQRKPLPINCDPCPVNQPNRSPRCPHCGQPYPVSDARPVGQSGQFECVLSDPVRSELSISAENQVCGPNVEQTRPVAAVQVGGPVSPDGRSVVTCDLPLELRKRNTGGSDGAGLCVFTSIEFSADYQNEPGLKEFQRFMLDKRGGGWPAKVDEMIRACSPTTRYIQYEGSSIDTARAALASGRLPAITWGGNHMLSLCHHDGEWAAALDNNFIGENELRWLRPPELLRLYNQGGGGWTVVLLAPRPPAPPVNRKGW